MINLIKENAAIVLLTGALIALLALDAFGLNMRSSLMAGGLTSVIVCIFWLGQMNPKYKFHKEEFMLFMFLGFFLVNLLVSKNPYGYQEFITFTGGALIYLLMSNIDTRKLPNMIINWGIVILTALFSSYGIYELLTSPSDRLDGLFHGAEVYSGYPNAMAQFLLFGIPLSWMLFRKYEFKSEKSAYLISGLLLLINITAFWLTFSRAGYIALAIMMGAGTAGYFIREKVPVKLFKIISIAITIIILGWICAIGLNAINQESVDIDERLTSKDISSQTSVNERYDFWSGSLKMASDNTVLGVGPGGFRYFYPEYQNKMLAVSDHPHNLILKILTESGYIAMLAFIMFLIFVGINAVWEYIWIKSKQSETYGILAVIFLGMSLHNLVDYNLNFTLLWIIYFGVMGLMENIYTWHEEEIADDMEKYIPRKNLYKAKLTLIALVVIGISIFQWYGYKEVKAAEEQTQNPELALNHLDKAVKFLPFKQQYYELLIKNGAQTIDYPQRLSDFPPIKFYEQSKKISTDEYDLATIKALAETQGKNDFSYHLLYLDALSASELETEFSIARAYYIDFLSTYIELMKQNAHQTVATENPYIADKIFNYFILNDTSNENIENWKRLYSEYTEAWQAEITKFNNRYSTEFNRITPNANINSYF